MQALLDEADDLIWTACAAARKIEVERQRGAGYYHAEVDWLLNALERLKSFREKRKALAAKPPEDRAPAEA